MLLRLSYTRHCCLLASLSNVRLHQHCCNFLLYTVCVCVVIPSILDVRLVDVPAGVIQEGHTGSLHLPSAVLAFILIARRIQLSLSLVEREVEFCVPTTLIVLHLLGMFFVFVFFCVRKT